MNVETRTHNEIDELWQRYAANREPGLKNEILTHYIPLVKSTVRRLMPKYKGYSESDDLINCGVIGLIDAVDKYDLEYGVKFETYASTRIRGEILDYLRKQDWAPSSLRRKINSINHAMEILENTFGRSPTDKEIADYMQMSVEDVRKILEKTHMFNLMYFEDMVTDTYFVDSSARTADNNPAEIMMNEEMLQTLADIIDELPEKERLVVTLYYYEEMKLKEIAAILKVTESRVSQIHSKVLAIIGEKLKKAVY